MQCTTYLFICREQEYVECLRGYPETFSLHCRKIMQHPCGNETQGDRKEQVGSA